MFVIRYRKIFFILSALAMALSLYSILAFGFNLSIDFKGGTITEASYSSGRPEKSTIEESIKVLNLGGFSVKPSGSSNYIVRTRELSVEEGQTLIQAIGNPIVERQNTVGPIAGAELQNKALKAIIVVVIMIVLFVTFAFRKVSVRLSRGAKGVSSWKYGLATIFALIHDIVIPVGVFVLLGKLYGFEIDLLFVSGLLAILGYSVHDTIVVFDRVRENLRVNEEMRLNEEFEIIVGKSVTQTLVRSINTSLTLLIMLVVLYFLASGATKDFSLLLIIGVIAGTYSSICLASPLLVTLSRLQKRS